MLSVSHASVYRRKWGRGRCAENFPRQPDLCVEGGEALMATTEELVRGVLCLFPVNPRNLERLTKPCLFQLPQIDPSLPPPPPRCSHAVSRTCCVGVLLGLILHGIVCSWSPSSLGSF